MKHHIDDMAKKSDYPPAWVVKGESSTISVIKLSTNTVTDSLPGYKTTNDNVKERLPEIMRSAGFTTVNSVKHFNTALGTVEIFRLRPQALTVI